MKVKQLIKDLQQFDLEANVDFEVVTDLHEATQFDYAIQYNGIISTEQGSKAKDIVLGFQKQ